MDICVLHCTSIQQLCYSFTLITSPMALAANLSHLYSQ